MTGHFLCDDLRKWLRAACKQEKVSVSGANREEDFGMATKLRCCHE